MVGSRCWVARSNNKSNKYNPINTETWNTCFCGSEVRKFKGVQEPNQVADGTTNMGYGTTFTDARVGIGLKGGDSEM